MTGWCHRGDQLLLAMNHAVLGQVLFENLPHVTRGGPAFRLCETDHRVSQLQDSARFPQIRSLGHRLRRP